MVIGNRDSKGSGSWLFAMKDIIGKEVDLYNITQSNVNTIQFTSYENLKEYVLPLFKLKKGIPRKENISKIKKIVDDIKPDIVHIWGIENYWGLLYTRGFLQGNTILEIQGLWSSCVNVYFGGIQISTLLMKISLKEILMPTIYLPNKLKSDILKKSVYENEMISYFEQISTQSEWTREQIKLKLNSKVKLFFTMIPMREIFYKSRKWSLPDVDLRPTIFTSFANNSPFKGLHILLNALTVLKRKYANVILKIAGINLPEIPFYRRSSYDNYLLKIISDENLSKHIDFLGHLNASQIANELLSSNVYVNPSFVESYSVAAAEALSLGVPSVLSYAGAMPEFSKEKVVALYYSSFDFVACAGKIDAILSDINLQKELTENSISVMSKINSNEQVCGIQMSIYKDVIERCLQHS